MSASPASSSASTSSTSEADRRVISIDIVSDTWADVWNHVKLMYSTYILSCLIDSLIFVYRIWPWCYIGKRRLEQALAIAHKTFPKLTFDIKWRPYELQPSLPKGKGYNKLQYYESKLGKELVRSMIPRMKDVAKECGIQMEYDGCVGNTLDSHVSGVINFLYCIIYLYHLCNIWWFPNYLCSVWFGKHVR
jgi:hypothetical protein